MNVFVGMETSGVSRRAFQARGHDVVSCDLLPADDEVRQVRDNEIITGPEPFHVIGDVFHVLQRLSYLDWWPDLALFHPTCTYLTISAEWAYQDGDYEKHPGVGYHQRVKPETLVGPERREARRDAIALVERLWALPIQHKAVENPIGVLSKIRKPTQIVQPWWFGDDASKGTCLWLDNLPPLVKTTVIEPRMVEYPAGSGKMLPRWGNQTVGGFNKLSPSDDRWKLRSATWPGMADAWADQWSAAA